MIKLTIDDLTVEVQPGTTVMEASRQLGIDIPHLCYYPGLSVSGNCRLCVVEVQGRPAPVISCELQCQENMVVQTHSQQLFEMRRQIIDLFLADHPLDCVVCEKAGSCLLQKYAYMFGLKETSYEQHVSRSLYQADNPFFVRDHQYCILCGRCVRVCDEVVGANAIDFVGRGAESHIGTPFDRSLRETSCVFCGNCLQVCPTAALMPVSRQGKGREWELERKKTICGYCGVGCQIEYALRDGKIIYAQSRTDAPVNGDYLCTKGRYGWDFVDNPDRLTTPMLRRDVAYEIGLTSQPWELSAESPLAMDKPEIHDSHIEIDWETAYEFVAGRLAKTVKVYGPVAVMGLSSARCTNEENYLFQKFMRVGIGTNNIDHCARL